MAIINKNDESWNKFLDFLLELCRREEFLDLLNVFMRKTKTQARTKSRTKSKTITNNAVIIIKNSGRKYDMLDRLFIT